MVLSLVDPGKTLPETLDYCKTWLQTVAGEIDVKSGIPPPLLTLKIKDFLNGPGKNPKFNLLIMFLGATSTDHKIIYNNSTSKDL